MTLIGIGRSKDGGVVLANFCEVKCFSQESGGKLEYWGKWHFSGGVSSLFCNLDGMRKKNYMKCDHCKNLFFLYAKKNMQWHCSKSGPVELVV